PNPGRNRRQERPVGLTVPTLRPLHQELELLVDEVGVAHAIRDRNLSRPPIEYFSDGRTPLETPLMTSLLSGGSFYESPLHRRLGLRRRDRRARAAVRAEAGPSAQLQGREVLRHCEGREERLRLDRQQLVWRHVEARRRQ